MQQSRFDMMTSHQLENANRDKIREMYNQMHLGDDDDAQKRLLFNLGLANMSWLEPSASGFEENGRKVGNSHRIEEIIAIYNSSTGDISFGINFIDNQMKTHGNFYPTVFQNLKSSFTKDTILAINMETAKKCHNSLNFHRREMIFFSKFASAKDLSNETKLVPVSLFV